MSNTSIFSPPSQVTTLNTSTQPSIGNLFAELSQLNLPDQVNTPTMERLKAFVVEELKLSASIVKPLTVRQLITALSDFNASSTLCWPAGTFCR